MKKEEDSPPHSTMLCPPVRTVPDKTSTTSTPPPAKAPPVSHTSYRNLSTRTTSQATPKTTSTQHTAAAPHPTAPPTPPSTTSSTSTEDPIILTTNVPILPKARPGHPRSIPLGLAPRAHITLHIPQHPHASHYRLPFHALTTMANFYPSTFPVTSNTTSIPQHTLPDDLAPLPFHPRHAQLHLLTFNQLPPQIPLPCSHQCHPSQMHH